MTSQEGGTAGSRLSGVSAERRPLVTLLWLNFNSMGNISLILDSLESMIGQDYPNFELLVIDNASEDGSWDAIRRHLQSAIGSRPNPPLRLLRTTRNLGYTGGFDYGYIDRDPLSKYVAVISDDAVLTKDYLSTLIGVMEAHPSIGAIQGIVSTLDGSRIDSMGALIDKLMIPHHIMRGEALGTPGTPLLVSFVEGTCPIYRIEALKKILGAHLFYPAGFFQYLEDNLNGLLLWNNGYRCVTIPKVVARHKREAGGGGLLRTYCLWRNRTALVKLTDSRYKPLEYLFGLASMLYMLLSAQREKARMVVRGAADGRRLASSMRREYGFTISLDQVPMYRLGLDYPMRLLSKSRGRGRLDEMDI